MSKLLVLGVAVALLCGMSSAEVKGVQAVLFHCWSTSSVNDFETTVQEIATSQPFALSSAPFIAGTRGCDLDFIKRLDNLEAATKAISGSGVQLRLITYLGGLHDSGLGKNTNLTGLLPDNFEKFWDRIVVLTSKYPSLVLVVGASLEDSYANSDAEEPQDALKALLGGITRLRKGETTSAQASARVGVLDLLVKSNRFLFIRSPDPKNTKSADFDRVFFHFGTAFITIPVIQESHGPLPGKIFTGRNSKDVSQFTAVKGYNVWSNDGPLVAYDCEGYSLAANAAKVEKCSFCTEFGDPQSIATFRAAVPALELFQLMWRPAYNAAAHDGDTFNKPGANRPIADLSFGNAGREKAALRRFITGKCPGQ